ncbi:MAG: CsgG/HfaB family protein [Spirochaetaceae bacterium]|nr:CsgG/HfaB family protein [Spirochaetaceae bacterium]
MANKIIGCVLLLCVFMGTLLTSCVSQPRFSDYVGLEKEEARSDLARVKTTNTIKLVVNWLTAGYFTAWIASVVDSIRALSFAGDFESIERRIAATPNGGRVGIDMPGTSTPANNAAAAVAPTAPTAPPAGVQGDIQGAVTRAVDLLLADIKKGSTVAVLGVTARDRNLSTFVADEVEFQLVDSKRFNMVDRQTIDTILDEQNFQMSGEVDDNSAVSIGNMLGANVIITGSLTGTGDTQRLTLKALDVKTAKIITMAREQY